MKTLTKTILCLFGLTLIPLALTAAKEKGKKPEYLLPEYKVEVVSELPKLVHLASPRVQVGLAGTTIELKFTVNERGFPKRVRPAKLLFCYRMIDDRVRDFACQMTQLVSYSKFEPATDSSGQPIQVNVRMPVKVVKRGADPLVTVSLRLDTPSTDKS